MVYIIIFHHIIKRVLQELSDENANNCRELESDGDLSDENIEDDNFVS